MRLDGFPVELTLDLLSLRFAPALFPELEGGEQPLHDNELPVSHKLHQAVEAQLQYVLNPFVPEINEVIKENGTEVYPHSPEDGDHKK